MIVYVVQHPEFFKRTTINEQIIDARLARLHKQFSACFNPEHLTPIEDYIQVDRAWKDYRTAFKL